MTVMVACLLSACVSVPGSDTPTPARFTLQGPARACIPARHSLALGAVQVTAGLDSDRIARLDSATGEVTFLRGIRWVDSAGYMLQQRLAADLECRGIAVQTGHRARAGQAELQCELRALNLRREGQGDLAEVALTCFHRPSGSDRDQALMKSARVPLDRWSGTAAVRALSAAYTRVFDDLFGAWYPGQ